MKSTVKKLLQKIFGYNTYLYIFARYIIATLKWNKNERDFLHFIKLLPPKGIVLDLGANIGVMSVYLGRSLPGCKIFAFEPIPSNIITLRRILKHFKIKNVDVVESALGECSGEVEMILPVVDNVKMQGLSHVLHESIICNNEGYKYKVQLKRLDDFMDIAQNGDVITGIKIDVENYEYYVLKGGESIIKKHRPLVYTELWDNDNRFNCFEMMKGMGYSVEVLVKGTLTKYNSEVHKTQNFFFIPNELN